MVKWTHPVKEIHWFPVPPPSSSIENIQTTTTGDVSTMTFDLVPAPGATAPMSFLVAFTDQDGKRQGVEFTVNLPLANQK
jgi:hypothetical protein